MKNKIYTLTLAMMFFLVGRSWGQCSTAAGGTICDSTKSFTPRGQLYAHYDWQSKVIPQTGYNYVSVYDSANGSLYDMMVLEIYTCGTNDLQLNISPGYAMSVVKYNLNNHNCGGSANNEHVIIYGKGSNITVYIMNNNCAATTDTVTFWYRKLASYPSNADGFGNPDAGDGEWIGTVYKWNNVPGYYYNNLGTTGHRPYNFTLDTGTVVPVTNGCSVCPSAATTDSFSVRFRMDTLQPRGFYKVTCNTSNDLQITTHGNLNTEVMDYWSNGSSSSTKTMTSLFVPVGTTNYNPYTNAIINYGEWQYRLKKATGNFKADITICQMDGDYTWGNNVWNAYVFDGNGTLFNNYIGQFGTSTPFIGFNWTNGQPNVNNTSCSQSMDDSLFKVNFLMKYNFAAGNYKFRIRSYNGGQTLLTDRKGVNTAYLANYTVNNHYDVTTAYNYLSGDTFLMIKVYTQGGTKSISYNHCRQPKDVGHITTSGGTVTGDSVCNGNTITLTADTTDGTETQWWKGATCGTGTLIGTGASINVTPDSSTTFYVRNRNYCVNSNDTANKIDLFSNSCTSRRITLVSKPSAPTSVTPSSATAICSGASLNLNGTSSGNTIYWFTQSSGGSAVGNSASGANYSVSPSSSATYYAESKAGTGCVSATRTATGAITVNTTPSAPSGVTPSSATAICSGVSLNLNGTSSGNTIYWFTQSSGGSAIGNSASGANYSVSPSSNTTYYAEAQTSTGCVSTSRTATGAVTVNANPSASSEPTAQESCNSGSQTYTFSNVTAGSGGDQVEWATNSNFTGSTTISSGGNIQVTVSSGSSTTVYLRSKVNTTGCVSSVVTTTATNNANPSAPSTPSTQSVCSDTAHLFTFSNVSAGSGGNQIEWATNSGFTGSSTISNGSNINVTVSSGSSTTIYLRSKVSSTGCVSSSTSTSATTNDVPDVLTAPNAQSVCSDTAHVFTFSNVTAGNGGNQVEWAENSLFSSGHTINSGGNFSVTVNAGSIDTVWLRSKVSVTGCVSETGLTKSTVNTFPNAIVTPSDTAVMPGDTVALRAIGGSSYFWIQFQSDSSVVKVIFQGDSAEYFVDVRNDNTGCGKLAKVILHQSLTQNEIIVTFENPNGSTFVACQDSIYMNIVSVYNSSSLYHITQNFPDGVIPDFSNTRVELGNGTLLSYNPTWQGWGQLVGQPPTPQVIQAIWNSNIQRLTWTIPGYYLGNNVSTNFLIRVGMIVTCDYNPNLITVFNNVDNPPFQLANAFLPTILVPSIQGAPLVTINAAPGGLVVDQFNICENGNAPIYNLYITPSTQPSIGYPVSINLTYNAQQYSFTANFGQPEFIDMMSKFGAPLDGGCIAVVCSSYVAPSCGNTLVTNYNVGIDCYNSNMCSVDIERDINVPDNDEGITVSAQLLDVNGNNVTSSGIDMCNSFSLKYTITNNSGSLSATTYAKVFKSFLTNLDPNWINISGAQSNLGTLSTNTPNSGDISIDFTTGNAVTLNGGQSFNFTISGLSIINSSGLYGPNCSVSPNQYFIGPPTIEYSTNCVSQVLYTLSQTQTVPYYANSGFGITPHVSAGQYVSGQWVPNSQISNGVNPILAFQWEQNPLDGDPMNFTSDGTGTPFFNCGQKDYYFRITLDPLVRPLSNSFTYSDESLSSYTGQLIDESNGLGHGPWKGLLPRFGNNVRIEIQVTLDNCPPTYLGGSIYPTLDVIEECVTGACHGKYCFLEMTNSLSVHCPGLCSGQGIGTESFSVTNSTSNPTPPAVDCTAYTCDLVHFHIDGIGYVASGTAPAPSLTTRIYAEISYPALLGSLDPIFDFSNLVNATYSCSTCTTAINSGTAIVTGPSGGWTFTVEIPTSNSALCQEIRGMDRDFSIDVDIPVECNLPMSNTGVYDLIDINAIMKYDATGQGGVSCDNQTANFSLLTHEYSTIVEVSEGTSPCTKILTITDVATGGFSINPEMNDPNRSLLSWGTITVVYPDNMSIVSSGIEYSDQSGNSPSTNIISNTFSILGQKMQTDIDGLSSIAGWPDYTKSGSEFTRQLVITFNTTSCNAEDIHVDLIHELMPSSCSNTLCNTNSIWTTYSTIPDITIPPSSNSIILTTTDDVDIYPLMTTDDISIDYTVNNPGANWVYYNASDNPSTNLNITGGWSNHTVITNNPLNVTLSNIAQSCSTQTITIHPEYSCVATNPPTTYCSSGSTNDITITVRQPNIFFTIDQAQTTGNSFVNCKGICANDEKIWAIKIVVASNDGPAYDPHLLISGQGPGVLLLGGIDFIYNPVTGVGSSSFNTFTSITNNFDEDITNYFPPNTFPHDNSLNDYLSPGDEIIALVHVYGDGTNCSGTANLFAQLSFDNVCHGHPFPKTLNRLYTFGPQSGCMPLTCTPIYSLANAATTCSACQGGAPMTLNPIIIQAPSCGLGSTDGYIEVQANGGVPHFDNATQTLVNPIISYTWSGPSGIISGITSNTANNLGAGTYSITAADETGCSATLSITLSNSGLVVQDAVTNAHCYGSQDGSISLTVSGGTSPYQYLWSPGGLTASNINNLSPGVYTVTITSNLSSSCTDPLILSYNVGGPNPWTYNYTVNPIVVCSVTNQILQNGEISFTDNSSYTYNWSTATSSGTGAIVTVNTPDTYTFTITDNQTSNPSCTITETINASSINSSNINGQSVVLNIENPCVGSNPIFTIGGLTGIAGSLCDISYTISGSSYTALNISIDVNGYSQDFNSSGLSLSAGSYTLTIFSITVQGGCTINFSPYPSVAFNMAAPPSAGISASSSIICPNHSINLTAIPHNSTPHSYSWQGPNSQVHNDFFWSNLSTAGTYEVTVTDNSGCSSSASVSITDLGNIAVSIIQNNELCSGNNSVTLSTQVTPNYSSYYYTWSYNSIHNTQINATQSQQTASYTVTVSAGNGCTASASHTVNKVNVDATIQSPQQGICNGSQINLFTPNSNGLSYGYNWSDGTNTWNQSNFFITPVTTTTVTVTVTEGNCSASSSVTVSVYDAINVSVTSTNTPCGTNNGSISLTVTGGSGSYTYIWSSGSTSQNLSALPIGSYAVTVTDANGCTSSASASVSSSTAISISETHLNVTCYGGNDGSIDISVSGGTSPYTYLWSDGTTTQDVSGIVAGNYSLTVTDANNCSESASVTITEPLALTTSGQIDYNDCSSNTDAEIDVSVQGGTPSYSYSWATGETTQDLMNVIPGSYHVTITDANNCSVATLYVVGSQPISLSGNISETNGNYSIELEVSGGIGSITYLWNNASTLQDIDNLTAGLYIVTVTDDVPCSATISFNIPEKAYCFYGNNVPDNIIEINNSISTSSGGFPAIPNGSFVYVAEYVTITINSNLTLTNCEIVMGKGSQIIVQPTFTLDLNHSDVHGCDDMWMGITVQGNSTVAQSTNTQGVLRINNYSTISDAYVAINFGTNSQAGGIVDAYKSSFINNWIDVLMWQWSYRNFNANGSTIDNVSRFIACDFITNADLKDASLLYPAVHMYVYWVDGLRVIGNKFENARTGLTTDDQLGSGIVALNASMTIDYFCGNLSCTTGKNSEFINLQHGIYAAEAVNVTKTLTVRRSYFTNCVRGIRNEDVDNCFIVDNHFTMGGNSTQITDDYPGADEGIILHHCTGFTVEQNDFDGSFATSNHAMIGIRADDTETGTGSSGNTIYKNTFTQLTCGNLANRQNQFTDANNISNGLQYRCNENQNQTYSYDIAVVVADLNSTPSYGVRSAQGSVNLSAGNTFSHNQSVWSYSDFYNSGVGLDYYFHDQQVNLSQNLEYPLYRTTATVSAPVVSSVQTNTCLDHYLFTTVGGACLTCLTYSGYSDAFSLHKIQADNSRIAYNNLIDGGNTEARLQQIDWATDAQALSDSMMYFSPNLSTTVLDTLTRQGGFLSDSLLYEILKANAEGVTNTILQNVASHREFTQDMLDTISAARQNLTYRTYLLDTIMEHTQQKEEALNQILHLILQDTIAYDEDDTIGINISLYRSWLDSSEALWAKEQMINSYLEEDNFDTIETFFARYDTLVSTDDTAAYNNFKTFTHTYKNWRQVDSSFSRLDSLQLEELIGIAQMDEFKKGTNMARNVLNFFYDSTYFTSPLLPDIQFFKRDENEHENETGQNAQTVNQEAPSIHLYPNPAQNTVTIEYKNISGESSLFVSNVLGEKIEQRTLKETNGKLTLNTASYQNGIYLTRVETEGSVLLKQKLVILK